MVLTFDFCAVLVFIIILFSVFLRKLVVGRTNKLYLALTVNLLVCSVIDFIVGLFYGNHINSTVLLVIINILVYLFFVLLFFVMFVYLSFILSITRVNLRSKGKTKDLLMLAPLVVLIGLLIYNLFSHKFFYVSARNGAHYGQLFIFIAVVYIVYVVMGFLLLIPSYRYLQKDKWFALLSFYIFSISAFIIQLVLSVPVLMFSMAISFLIILLVIMRAEESIDIDTGLQNYNAFKSEIKKVIVTGRKIQVMLVRYINAFEVRSIKGEEEYSNYIKRIANLFVDTDKKAGGNSEIFYETSGGFYLMSDRTETPNFSFNEMIPKMRSLRMEEFKGSVDSGLKLNPVFSMIIIPEDSNSYDEIISYCENFHRFFNEDRKFIPAAEIMHRSDYRLLRDMDLILDRAIKNQSFYIYYQPIYSQKEKRFVSAEALLRLKDPLCGEIPPQVFIREAERNGRISEIGDFVLNSVFKFVSELDFEETGLSFIEINLSVAQCIQKNISEKIKKYAETYGVDPSHINFEITETAYNSAKDIMDRNINKLSEQGYTFSLDDYGTGYSNMQRILSLPLKIVKIDKSLIDEIQNEKDKSIVRNTINMMQDISMQVVVEGVERQSTFDALSNLGADYIQGFYFARPMPASEFTEFVKKRKTISKLFYE